MCIAFSTQKESEKRNVTVQPDDPISFMQLTAKNEMNCKEDQFQLSLLAAMGNTQRKEAADPLASKLNKVTQYLIYNLLVVVVLFILGGVSHACLKLSSLPGAKIKGLYHHVHLKMYLN